MKKIIKLTCSALITLMILLPAITLVAEKNSPVIYIISIALVIIGTYFNNKDEQSKNTMLGLSLIVIGVLIITIDGGSKLMMKISHAGLYSPLHFALTAVEVSSLIPCITIMVLDFIDYFKKK